MKPLGMKSKVALQFRFLPEVYGQGLNCSMGNYNNGLQFAVWIRPELLPYRLVRSNNCAHLWVKYFCKQIPRIHNLNKLVEIS